MPHLLHLDSSADPRSSSSRAVTAAFVRGWQERGGAFTVTSRDLQADPPPHLPDAALHWAPRLRTAEETVDPADELRQQGYLDELLAADVLLVGAPMYNWSLPSTLKAWVDHVHVLGTTVPFGDFEARPLAGRPRPRRRPPPPCGAGAPSAGRRRAGAAAGRRAGRGR